MSFRGRGGFGGRGGGRFSGGRGYVPQARGDDGQPVFAKKTEGPPPLFPPITFLPDLPDIGKVEEELVSRRRRLETFWNASPYYIEKPKETTTGVAVEIERYSDKYKPHFHSKRPPLSSVLKLTSAYFPAELIGQHAGRKRGRDGQYKGTSQWTLQPTTAKSDLQRLDRLANLEQRSQKLTEENEGKEEEEKKAGEGDDDDEEEVEEDEEEDFNEDDYAQTFGFDDDDEYLDDDDGGDDEGPTF